MRKSPCFSQNTDKMRVKPQPSAHVTSYKLVRKVSDTSRLAYFVRVNCSLATRSIAITQSWDLNPKGVGTKPQNYV